MFASLAELKVQLEPIKKFKKNDFHLKYLLGSIPRMVPSALLIWMLPSPPRLIFKVYMFTLLLNELEKTVIIKNRNCKVNQLNQDEKR